jgi:peptidoglycan/LPS O-acetylase OafA/YrhL
VSRSNVAVSFFITMSGFITHWAYGRKPLAGGAFKQYLARRLGRVLFTTWVAMLLGLVVMLSTAPWSIGDPGHVARCFCFAESWLHPAAWCPNGQASRGCPFVNL